MWCWHGRLRWVVVVVAAPRCCGSGAGADALALGCCLAMVLPGSWAAAVPRRNARARCVVTNRLPPPVPIGCRRQYSTFSFLLKQWITVEIEVRSLDAENFFNDAKIFFSSRLVSFFFGSPNVCCRACLNAKGALHGQPASPPPPPPHFPFLLVSSYSVQQLGLVDIKRKDGASILASQPCVLAGVQVMARWTVVVSAQRVGAAIKQQRNRGSWPDAAGTRDLPRP